MSESTNNPNEPRKLDDAELGEVTGGTVYKWNAHEDNNAHRSHHEEVQRLGANRNFGEWLRAAQGEGAYQAWQAWNLQRNNVYYTSYYDDQTGKTWSELN